MIAPSLRPLTTTLLAALLLLGMPGCKKKQKPFPPAPQLLSTATTEGAAIGPANALATPVADAAPVDNMAPADRAAFDAVKESNRDLGALMKRGAFSDPDKPGQGDANAQCSAIETPRSRLEALDDPEAKQLVTESQRLCSLEVPLISADRTIKQLGNSTSQASRQLMCKYAAKDLDKARTMNRNDRRLRDLEARLGRLCR